MQPSVDQCVHAALTNAIQKFKKTPPWAEIQVIVLDCSTMTPARLAANAVRAFDSQDKEAISHFLIIDGESIEEAKAIVASAERETEAEEQCQQAHIVESPLSETRIQKFKDDYLKGRRDIGATEKIFRYFGTFQHKTTVNRLASFGFNTLVNKGPFVDGSNWGDLRGWQFAVQEERYLLKKLHGYLVQSISGTGQVVPDTVPPKADRILKASKRMADLLGRRHRSLIVLAAHLDIDAIVTLERALTTPTWDLDDELRTNWILGKYEDCPVLHLNDQDSMSLYVVDVPRFASLIQYDPVVDLQVSAIDEETAKEMLQSQPDLPWDENTLLSMVRLTLWQSYEIQVHDRSAVWATKLST